MESIRDKLFIGAAIAAAIALALTAAAGAEKPVAVQAGNVELRLNSGYTPNTVSRTVPTPVAFNIAASLRTIDGSHPPALSQLLLAIDRNSAIDVSGLPVCDPKVQYESTRTVETACRKAIVGSGIANFEIAFPEALPSAASGKMIISNGGVRGDVTTLYAHTYISIPIPAEIVLTIAIKKLEHGRFGSEAVVSIPKIAGGDGSLTDFSAAIGRPSTEEGGGSRVVTLKCTDGKIRTRVEANFANGTQTAVKLVRRCIPKS